MSNRFFSHNTAATTTTSTPSATSATSALAAGLSAAELDGELVQTLPEREEMCSLYHSHHHHHHHHCCSDNYGCNDSGKFKVTFGGNPPVKPTHPVLPIVGTTLSPIGPTRLAQ